MANQWPNKEDFFFGGNKNNKKGLEEKNINFILIR